MGPGPFDGGIGGGFEGLVPPVVVACSGGSDSLALLVLAADHGLKPVAVHVDHGLRPESASEAAVVRGAAAGVGAGFRSCAIAVRDGGNLEERARDARYRALETARVDVGATAVLVGHTADDQAETILLNLLRGSGSAGLAGMPVRRGRVVRPLLGLRRAALAALCEERGLHPVDDPSNRDVRHRRSWVRHEVLPLLSRGVQRDLVPVLTRQAALLRDESELLDRLADDLLETAGRVTPTVAHLAVAPPALARRAVRRWLGAPPPSAAEVERVLTVARHEQHATELTAGRRVERTGGRLVLHDERSVCDSPARRPTTDRTPPRAVPSQP